MAKRDFRREYDEYQGTPEQIAKRSSRNKARRKLVAEGKVKKGDGKEVDHKNLNALDDSGGNLQVLSRHANRVKQPAHKNNRGWRK